MNDTTASTPRCYFAFRSPYSRLGLHKLAKAGFDGELVIFTGPPDDAAFYDPTTNKYKLAYYQQDVFRMTVRMGLPLALPDPFDPDYRLANLSFIAAQNAGQGLDFAIAVSDARWGEGKNISEPGVLAGAAKAAGWDGFDARAIGADTSLAQTIKDQRALIEADGVFGVPFLVDGRDKYWGQDRFDLWLEEKAG
ncbi:2-hydroxychromene-2-carboxylate isomerase [Oceanicaulis sp. MMSF_3324]|uniref:2-hydroxychromene-2-carboxylate isomerase n=1 Tax=Oceanicaulis sp. MMSF_3324 TaxID=3046702 RepID=UPI00273FD168|nr:DsbA family protein [Oceanicaulis sp. MMSF_3324]